MDILFVNPQDTMSLKDEVNGQLLLGTLLLQAGFDVDILRFCQIEGFGSEYATFIKNMVQTIVDRDPKAVSFYSLWPDCHITLRIAKELKAVCPDVYVILAGPQPSATARETLEAMPYVDAVCTGEGEETVVPLFTALLRKGGVGLNDVPGLYYRENGAIVTPTKEPPLCDLDTLPRWDNRLYWKHYENSGENWASKGYYMPIDAGRGCPFKCTFCYANAIRKRSYRMKSPERIVEDIRFFKEKFGITSFWFTHDAFTTNKNLVEKVCDYLIQENMNITWRCTTRMDCISKELIDKMKRSGLNSIEVGVESGSPRMQKLVHKNLNLAMVEENARYILDQGIVLSTFFMYGFPEETEQDLFETIHMGLDLLDAGVTYASMSFCRFNPTTQMTMQHMEQLTLNPKTDVLTRDIFGYKEEMDIVADNRSIFPFYYDLETPLRRKYQYVRYLLVLYQRLSLSKRYIRAAFGFDTVKLVQAFMDGNAECFAGGLDAIVEQLRSQPQELLCKMVDQLDQPWTEQLKAVIRFDFDQRKAQRAKKDYTFIGEYAFCYADLKQGKELAQFSEGTTHILFQKKNGNLSIMQLKK